MTQAEVPDGVARACAWADHLAGCDRKDTARQVLQEALSQHADAAELMLALAELDWADGDKESAIGLLRKALAEHPGHHATAQRLTRMLLSQGRGEEATAIAETLPSSQAVKELAGEIFWMLGQHARAVEVLGDPEALSQYGRWLRRRSWWRSGGPFRRRGRTPPAPAAEPAAIAEPPDAVLEVVAWAERLSEQERTDEAQQEILAAMTTHGRHPRLLRCLAELESSADAPQTALYLWREAYVAAPADVDIVCGLARQLSDTWLAVSEVTRFQEAVQILDAFADQQHPDIRAARGHIFNYYGTSLSRAVAAYGPAAGLPPDAAGNRRRCWWRSAGPAGQLRMRMVDWRWGPWSALTEQPAPRGDAETEEVARLLDQVGSLPSASARERLEEAWQQHGRLPSLLLAHAALDLRNGGNWPCLALSAEVLRSHPGHVEAACLFASSLSYLTLFTYGSAVAVLENVPAATRQSTGVRVTLGDIHRRAGNHALAVAAYGDPRHLDGFDRRSRRRIRRRGLLQRRGNRSDDRLATVALHPLDFAVAQALDKERTLADSPESGRAVLDAAIAEHGRHPLLLVALARACRATGDPQSSASLAQEAAASAQADQLILAIAIYELWLSGFSAEAFGILDSDPPDKPGTNPSLRAVAGFLCDSWKLPCHAVLAYGNVLLGSPDRRIRRICWWLSGGPYPRLRSEIEDSEFRVASDWKLPEPQLTALRALQLPDGLEDAVRSAICAYRKDYMRRSRQVPDTRIAWLTWVLGPTSAVMAAILLAVIEQLRWPAHQVWQSAIIGAALITAAYVALSRTQRGQILLAAGVASGAAAAPLLLAHAQWMFTAGLLLATLATAVAGLLPLDLILGAVLAIRTARWRRDHATTAGLGDLLNLLAETAALRRRRDVRGQRQWMASAEEAAVALERDLPHALRSGDRESQAAITARARGAAGALRAMKRSIALADESSWDQVTAQLNTLATALAKGDLMALPAAAPSASAPRPPLPLRARVMQIARALLVIVTPPLVAFLLPLFVRQGGPGWAWLRLATIVWALLAAIVALDPGIADKVSSMRAVLSLWREVGGSQGGEGQASQHSPAEQAVPSQRPGPPSRPPGSTYPRKHERKTFR
jgi:tetratricopeptide (TPR) repeat protein